MSAQKSLEHLTKRVAPLLNDRHTLVYKRFHKWFEVERRKNDNTIDEHSGRIQQNAHELRLAQHYLTLESRDLEDVYAPYEAILDFPTREVRFRKQRGLYIAEYSCAFDAEAAPLVTDSSKHFAYLHSAFAQMIRRKSENNGLLNEEAQEVVYHKVRQTPLKRRLGLAPGAPLPKSAISIVDLTEQL